LVNLFLTPASLSTTFKLGKIAVFTEYGNSLRPAAYFVSNNFSFRQEFPVGNILADLARNSMAANDRFKEAS